MADKTSFNKKKSTSAAICLVNYVNFFIFIFASFYYVYKIV